MNSFKEAERKYVCSLKPPGFARAWEATYRPRPRCWFGPWRIPPRRWMITGAIERGNRWEWTWRTSIGDSVHAYEIAIPLGIGSVAVWWYRVNRVTT